MFVEVIGCGRRGRIVLVIFPEIPEWVGTVNRRPRGNRGSVGIRSAVCDISERITRLHTHNTACTIGIFVTVGTVNRVAIVGKSNQWRVFGTVNNIQTIGRIGRADIGNNDQIQIEGRRVLMMVIVSHCGVRFGAIKSHPFCHHGIPVPYSVAHTSQRTTCQRAGGVAPRDAISVVEKCHTVDEKSDITRGCGCWRSCVWRRAQRKFEDRILCGSNGGVSVQKWPGDIRWNTVGVDIYTAARVSYHLYVGDSRIVDRNGIA